MQNAPFYDAIIVHGIWGYGSRAVRQVSKRTGTPYIVFVHGALDPWFKRQYPVKHAKKWLYWLLSAHQSLSDANAALFTQKEERDLARNSFRPYKIREAIVPIGIDDPPPNAAHQREIFFSEYPELRHKRILLFLSRLHPKKGCDLLIRSFAEVAEADAALQLVIAGPDDCGWEKSLRVLTSELHIESRVTWLGTVTGDLKWGAYRAAEAFTLISHSENFGIVVTEAMACGLPVLTTNKVNIWPDIQRSGAGIIASDDQVGATVLLRTWLEKPDSERAQMREAARRCYVNNFGSHAAATEFVRFLRKAIDQASGSSETKRALHD
ncbi:hypothetical protein NGTWS0302_38390 [Mycolicibacterium cyprinidarum]|uniref:Glycosyl transferase family 1 domain-containing protein n=1 Tax=Mycolicibacterium cyprinidarum TaxID=2860311 RepID=A0ABQ4V6E6_9MYCO|nr:hypothetical protein NGTWS1702_37120 [Mycolicibacterium sp. NGTWSNA01]GJF15308.1 hypothetical protein NGTWS0302_38390 [Mycolicibacterium sp. NGTWS0302]